jgi:hypothetical protein
VHQRTTKKDRRPRVQSRHVVLKPFLWNICCGGFAGIRITENPVRNAIRGEISELLDDSQRLRSGSKKRIDVGFRKINW